MKKQQMKRVLKTISNPVKRELFKELGYTKEEITLMEYLYIEKINQPWVSDEMGISMPTLTKIHNDCINQLINFFHYEKYKYEHNEENRLTKYFGGIENLT